MSTNKQVTSRNDDQIPISHEELKRALPKRKIAFMTWVVVAVAAFVVMPMIAYVCWVNVTHQRFEKRLSDLVAAGQPVTSEGLAEYYSLPAGSIDSTDLYLRAIEVVSTNPYGPDTTGIPLVDRSFDSPPPSPGKPWGEFSKAEEFLKKYESTLQALHDASDQGGEARFPLNFEDGFLTLLQHAQELRNITNLLRLEAYVNAHNGDSENVARSIRSGLAAAVSVKNEPLLVSQMISMIVISQVLDTLEELLPYVDFTDTELASLQDSIRSNNVRESWRRAFIGEQAMVIYALADADREQMSQAATANEAVGIPAIVLATLGSRYDDLTLYTECMEQFLEAFDKPWPEAIRLVDKITDQTRANTEGPIRQIRYALTRVCLSVPYDGGEVLEKAAVVDAELRIADTLLAARRYQLAKGRLPTTIDDLVPNYLSTTPSDPYDPKKPLLTMSMPNAFRIYSVGPNQLDDSRAPGNVTDNETGPDIVMELRVAE